MDATIQGLRLPEGFAGMLEDNGLPLPPLPLGVLNVVLDAERCAWRLDTPEGDVQQQGEGLYALLDLMQGLDSGLVGMSNVNWMRV